MKTAFLLTAALAVMSGFSLYGAEPRDTVDYYFSFFNPGGPKELKDFRSCFVPEEREMIKAAPKEEIRTRYPVGKVNITDVMQMINHVSVEAQVCEICGDLNGDGNVNITDITMLINKIAQQ